jgi:hypothetical protein
VSVKEKSRHGIVAGKDQGDERERTAEEVSKCIGRRQNWWRTRRQDEHRGSLLTACVAPGIKAA